MTLGKKQEMSAEMVAMLSSLSKKLDRIETLIDSISEKLEKIKRMIGDESDIQHPPDSK